MLGSLGLLGGDQVTRYGADVSVFTPSIFADVSKPILALADNLKASGFLANISSIQPGHVYSNFHVILSKQGNAVFSLNDAMVALKLATAAQSLSIMSIVDAYKDIVVFAAEIPGTAASDKGKQQTKDTVKNFVQDQVIPFVGNPICGAIEGATGLKCKTVLIGGAVLVGGAFAIIYGGPVFSLVSKLANKTLGGLSGPTPKKRKRSRSGKKK